MSNTEQVMLQALDAIEDMSVKSANGLDRSDIERLANSATALRAALAAAQQSLGGDIGQAVESVLRGVFGGADHQIQCVAHEFICAAQEQQRPSVLFKPSISVDGNQYCALFGENLQSGVAGFGNSPELAMRDFDKEWHVAINPTGGTI